MKIICKIICIVSILGLSTVLLSCKADNTRFERISSDISGIDFINPIEETDSFNVLKYENIYNGGGVATADFNGNGYKDLFFVGNLTYNGLYLNEGNFKFKDVSEESGIIGSLEKWYSGVAVIDINNNGLPDIYLSATGRGEKELRRNELYVNQGVNEEGIPIFKEMAEEYGLDESSYTTQAYFFDYNNDGVLDVYLLVAHSATGRKGNPQRGNDPDVNKDRLLRGEWNYEKGHPVFTDVSEQAGINRNGYGLGANIIDINGNGYKDIYVANDFITDDLFWINNGDGTFTDHGRELFKHFSYAAMGTDFADLNNNGLMDIFTLDMLSEVNVKRKMREMVNFEGAGYHNQYTRNTLQLNLGAIDSTGLPVFSEVAIQAGIAETDWSWATLLADLDNDGFIDIFVTNGIPKDVTDKDFWADYGRVMGVTPMEFSLPKIPELKTANYSFKNNGTHSNGDYTVTFSNVTKSWGLDEPTYSTGAVYVDLNNNGALDLVISNINQPAFIYRNRLFDNETEGIKNWLKIQFEGPEKNRMGIGAKADLFFGNGYHQTYEHNPYRGYLSSVDPVAHFGLGNVHQVDSLVVTWPIVHGERLRQSFKNVDVNQTITVDITTANPVEKMSQKASIPLFNEITKEKGITYQHMKPHINDASIQPLLTYQLSGFGTGIVSGDINGNGLDDLFIGGAYGQGDYGKTAVILYQNDDGSFTEVPFEPQGEEINPNREDTSVLLFDANGNGFLDIYIVSGGLESEQESENYQDRFYRNNGDGTFSYLPDAIPTKKISGSVAVSGDFNGNGKLDLFVGGRMNPGRYPEPVSSYILRNDSDQDEILFTDVTDEVAPFLQKFGVVHDAIWSDFNNSGLPGLIITAGWKPVTFLENRDGVFKDITGQTGISDKVGWWFTIEEIDITGNGLPDYVAGNLGLNSFFKATSEESVSIYFGDLTEDGFFESIPTMFGRDLDGSKKEFPYHNRELMVLQMPEMASRFPTHRDYGMATITDLLTTEQKKRASVYKANYFESSVLINNGDGTIHMNALPPSAQASPIFGIAVSDFNGNGYTDLILSGNLDVADFQTASYNALNGLLLTGNGDGSFDVKYPGESGIYIPGDGRSAVTLSSADGKKIVAVLQNNGPLKLFELQ